MKNNGKMNSISHALLLLRWVKKNLFIILAYKDKPLVKLLNKIIIWFCCKEIFFCNYTFRNVIYFN